MFSSYRLCEQFFQKKCCVPKISIGSFMWLIREKDKDKEKVYFADAIHEFANLLKKTEKEKATLMLKNFNRSKTEALPA